MQYQFNDYPQPDESSVDSPDKVLRITPGQGGMVSFKVDFERDGVGGQQPGGENSTNEFSGPMEVVVQAGEYQVIHSIIQSSLPTLVGWSTCLDVAMQHSITYAIQSGGNQGRGPRFSTSGPHDDVPF
jgi:hypothetical protein